MPPPIEQEILHLAIIHPSKSDARGLPQSLQDEITTLVEAAAHNLKHSFPRLEIVERARIDVAIKELEFQASGHVRDDNFVGVGRMLGTDHLFIYQVTANFDRDMESFQRYGGYVRSIASGKLIRVQTGTVVFQQTAQQESFFRSAPIGRLWAVPSIEGAKRGTALLALEGLFLSLTEAFLPSPIGILWNDEPGGNRVKVLEVLTYSPAHNVGLQRGDIITAIDGIPVRRQGDKVMQDLEIIPRELVHITIQRKGQEQTFAVRPSQRRVVREGSK